MHNHKHHNVSNNILLVLIITGLFMLVEFAGGFYTKSLALTADAGHMLSDVGALVLSYFAIWLSSKPASAEKTYGYLRAEVLAAFINGIALVVIALYIIYEAVIRISTPNEVNAPTMMLIAMIGLVINAIGAFLLHKDSKSNLNIRGAFLHIIGDLLGSIGTIIAAFMILYWNLYLADSVISIIIALLVMYSSIKLINETVNILLEVAPSHINVKAIEVSLMEVPQVEKVYDLHVWSIAPHKVALSVHIVSSQSDTKELLNTVNNLLKEGFNIHHSTIQIESDGFSHNKCEFC